MSADNLIYVQEREHQFFIWHGFASDEDPKIPSDAEVRKTKAEALDRAHALEEEIGTEYGVNLLPP